MFGNKLVDPDEPKAGGAFVWLAGFPKVGTGLAAAAGAAPPKIKGVELAAVTFDVFAPEKLKLGAAGVELWAFAPKTNGVAAAGAVLVEVAAG